MNTASIHVEPEIVWNQVYSAQLDHRKEFKPAIIHVLDKMDFIPQKAEVYIFFKKLFKALLTDNIVWVEHMSQNLIVNCI